MIALRRHAHDPAAARLAAEYAADAVALGRRTPGLPSAQLLAAADTLRGAAAIALDEATAAIGARNLPLAANRTAEARRLLDRVEVLERAANDGELGAVA